jgi:biotin operon repressor
MNTRVPEPPEPIALPWRQIAGALPLLDLSPTEAALVLHLLGHGKPIGRWTNYDHGDLSVALTGQTGCSASRIGRAINNLRRRGYLWHWLDGHGRSVLGLTPKLDDDAIVAERHRRIYTAVGIKMWERLDGYTPKMADAVDKAAALQRHSKETDRWKAAAKQIADNVVIEWEAARQRQRNKARPL